MKNTGINMKNATNGGWIITVNDTEIVDAPDSPMSKFTKAASNAYIAKTDDEAIALVTAFIRGDR